MVLEDAPNVINPKFRPFPASLPFELPLQVRLESCRARKLSMLVCTVARANHACILRLRLLTAGASNFASNHVLQDYKV